MNRDTHRDAREAELVSTQKAPHECAPAPPIWKHFPQAKAQQNQQQIVSIFFTVGIGFWSFQAENPTWTFTIYAPCMQGM